MEYISVFKYGYQIFTESEFLNVQPLDCVLNPLLPCDALTQRANFKESMLESLIALISITLGLILISLMILIFKGRNKN